MTASLRHVGRTLRSSDKFRLEPLTARCLLGEGSFCIVGPRLWNELPEAIRCDLSFSAVYAHVTAGFFSLL